MNVVIDDVREPMPDGGSGFDAVDVERLKCGLCWTYASKNRRCSSGLGYKAVLQTSGAFGEW